MVISIVINVLTIIIRIMKSFKLYIFLLGILFYTSCVERVNLKPLDDRMMTVDCILRNTNIQQLKLYYTNDYIKNEYSVYEDIIEADIKLFIHHSESDSLLIGSFAYCEDGIWELEYMPREGYSYSLIIESKGEILYARTSMPDKIAVQYRIHPMYCGFKSPGLSASSRRDLSYMPSYTLLVDGISSIWAYGLNCNEEMVPYIFTSHTDTDDFNLSALDTLFKYSKHFGTEDMDIREYTIPLQFHNYFVRFTHTPDYLNSYYYFCDLNENSDFWALLNNFKKEWSLGKDGSLWGECFLLSGKSDIDTLVLMNVSDEYDKYLRSVVPMLFNDSADFTEIFNTESPYTNIHNGRGIFGATFVLKTTPMGCTPYLGE